MRQHGVDRQRCQRVLGIGQLLDQPDTVDDNVRAYFGQHRNERVLIKHVHTTEQTFLALLREVPQRRAAAELPQRNQNLSAHVTDGSCQDIDSIISHHTRRH